MTTDDPLSCLAWMALDEHQHPRVHAARDGDHVVVEEHEGKQVVQRWSGSVVAWDHALHQVAQTRSPVACDREADDGREP